MNKENNVSSTWQDTVLAIAEHYMGLSLQDKINVIAQTFRCKTGKICTSPCTGKWRGTSDMTIRFDNGASLFIGNSLTPKTKTKKLQTEYVNYAIARYNPEIVQASKEAALPMLLQREAKDNEIAAKKGLKPYTLLNVEFNDGTAEQTGGYIGWYYVTLAVDGEIHTHLETGLSHDIANGKVSDTPTRADYFTAGALKETDVDYVFNNVGFSSTSTLYALPLREDVRERAVKTLIHRRNKILGTKMCCVSIYQLSNDAGNHYLRFATLNELQESETPVDKNNYHLVYSMPEEILEGYLEDSLEGIFQIFNRYIPEDFHGHSLSISDVIVISTDNEERAFYCDVIGFKELPHF